MSPCDPETASLLLSKELDLMEPAVRRDPQRVLALLAEDFVEFGASGSVWSRDAIADLLRTESFEPPAVEGLQCHHIAPGVALVTYRTVRANADQASPASTLRTSLWIRQSGEWRVRFHQGTPLRAAQQSLEFPG